MEAVKSSSSEHRRPERITPGPFEWHSEPGGYSERTPEPFWGRFTRAIGLLLLAVSAHLWLVRVPEPAVPAASLLLATTPSISLSRPVAHAPTAPAAVRVVTELVPVGTSGVFRDPPPATLRAESTTQPAVKLPDERIGDAPADLRADTRTAGTTVLEARPDGPADAAQASMKSDTPIAPPPLTLTHVVSSASLIQHPPNLSPVAASITSPGSTSASASAARTFPPVSSSANASAAKGPSELHAEPDRQRVKQLLQDYVQAFERLDVDAAKAVWPTVNDKALRRAFQELEAQHLTLQSCGITIDGSDANARCTGKASYRPRIGSRALRISEREWTFNLAKADAGWQIVDAKVR